MALNSGIQTYEIFTNDDEVCIQSLSSILLAVILAGLPITEPYWFNTQLSDWSTCRKFMKGIQVDRSDDKPDSLQIIIGLIQNIRFATEFCF